MRKKKVYLGIVVVLVIIALAILFSGKVASQKGPETNSVAPTATEIPDNMSVSEEIGG